MIGAMADDQIYNYVSDYIDGVITREQFWALARFKYPTHQIVFCTDAAMKTFQISDKIKEVSRIGIGCMRITGFPDEKAVRELIDGAMELGINFFDHADIYAAGEAEAVFGNVLTPTLREQMVIQTKCAIRPGICYDFSKEHILTVSRRKSEATEDGLCGYSSFAPAGCIDGAGRGSRGL